MELKHTECLANILNIERLNIQRIETQERNSVVDVKAHGESGDEVGAHLESLVADGVLAGPQLDPFLLDVHAHLELAMINQRRIAKRQVSIRKEFWAVFFQGILVHLIRC